GEDPIPVSSEPLHKHSRAPESALRIPPDLLNQIVIWFLASGPTFNDVSQLRMNGHAARMLASVLPSFTWNRPSRTSRTRNSNNSETRRPDRAAIFMQSRKRASGAVWINSLTSSSVQGDPFCPADPRLPLTDSCCPAHGFS